MFNFSHHLSKVGALRFVLVVLFVSTLAMGAGYPLFLTHAGEADRPLEVRVLGDCGDPGGLVTLAYGLGTDGLTGGSFNVTGIPDGAEVVFAWLYWNGADDGNNVSDDPDSFDPRIHDGDPTVTLNGIQVPRPDRIGGPANWVGVRDAYAYAYRSDVSSMVSGNGVYVLEGMDNFYGTQGYNNGAELVIAYRDANTSPSYLGVAEGLDLIYGANGPNVGPGSRVALFQFRGAAVKRRGSLNVFLGGADGRAETALWYKVGVGAPPADLTFYQLIGEPGAVQIADPFTGKNNQNQNGYWDSYQIKITIPAHATWLAVQVESKNALNPAALEWVGAVWTMERSCFPMLYTPLLLRG